MYSQGFAAAIRDRCCRATGGKRTPGPDIPTITFSLASIRTAPPPLRLSLWSPQYLCPPTKQRFCRLFLGTQRAILPRHVSTLLVSCLPHYDGPYGPSLTAHPLTPADGPAEIERSNTACGGVSRHNHLPTSHDGAACDGPDTSRPACSLLSLEKSGSLPGCSSLACAVASGPTRAPNVSGPPAKGPPACGADSGCGATATCGASRW